MWYVIDMIKSAVIQFHTNAINQKPYETLEWPPHNNVVIVCLVLLDLVWPLNNELHFYKFINDIDKFEKIDPTRKTCKHDKQTGIYFWRRVQNATFIGCSRTIYMSEYFSNVDILIRQNVNQNKLLWNLCTQKMVNRADNMLEKAKKILTIVSLIWIFMHFLSKLYQWKPLLKARWKLTSW